MFDNIYTEIIGNFQEAGNLYSVEHENCLVGFENLLRKFNIVIQSRGDLEQNNYLNFKKFPHILTSQTHTRGISISAISFTNNYKSIGIDLEKRDRTINSNTHRLFFHSQDSEELKADPLKLWTIKEAVYKAANPILRDKKNTLRDYYVDKNLDFFIENNAELFGKTKVEEILIKNHSFLFACAIIY
ncbi:MAG: 4'-phosphopantetheinyl transferase superfamily protein [Bacteriovoracaceae bacterium]